MAYEVDSVLALKTAFLATQIRVLSQTLDFPAELRERTSVSDSALDDVAKEVTRLVRRHSKTAYDALAVRNVAEQIDALYWEAGAPDDSYSSERIPEDLTSDSVISNLPSDLPDADYDEYAEKLSRLRELSGHRAALQKKLATYRQLQAAILPLKNPTVSIQPSLVTRDGALVEELNKTRNLAVRASNGIAGLTSGR